MERSSHGTSSMSPRPVSAVSRARSSGSWLEGDLAHAHAPPVPTFLPVFPRSFAASSIDAPPNSDAQSSYSEEHLRKSPAIEHWANSVESISSHEEKSDYKARWGPAMTEVTSVSGDGDIWVRPGAHDKWHKRWKRYRTWIAVGAVLAGLLIVLVVVLLVKKRGSQAQTRVPGSNELGATPETVIVLSSGGGADETFTTIVTLTESGRAGGTVLVANGSTLSGSAVSSFLGASPSLLTVVTTSAARTSTTTISAGRVITVAAPAPPPQTNTIVRPTATVPVATNVPAQAPAPAPAPALAPPVAPTPPPVISATGNQVLAATATAVDTFAYWRNRFSAGPLTWDTTLEAAALREATSCDVSGADHGLQGQTTSEGPADIENAIRYWIFANDRYDFANMPARDFAQSVWKSTTRVGCGGAQCSKGDVPTTVWVCRYAEAGNIPGNFAANVSPELKRMFVRHRAEGRQHGR